MFETLKNAWKVKDIRIKIIITILLLLVYRIGCYIPVPGVDFAQINTVFGGTGADFQTIMNALTGGALANGALFAMGIGPYINASIIMQLLTVGIPRLERLSKQGEDGRKKIAQYTRYVTIVLAIIQAVGIIFSLGKVNGSSGVIDPTLFFNGKAQWLAYTIIIVIFTAGSALTMWLGERITEKGIGNGISLLIFVGILSTAANALVTEFGKVFAGGADSNTALWSIIGFLIALLAIFTLIVFFDLAERRIPVQYAKQVKGRKMYGGQSTHIPIRLNASGVMPLIFAFALVAFPQLIANMINANGSFTLWWGRVFGTGTIGYAILTSVLILFFSFFYGQIQFNPEDVSKNIQQYGGFIPGIRPGKPTTEYLARVSNRITLFGAIFLAFIALVPSIIFIAVAGEGSSLINAFSTTGLLIVVSVALEFDKQLEGQIMMKHYKGFLD